MEYKRYSGLVIGWGIAILLVVAGFTYRVDPGDIFCNALVETCGKWMLEGHDISITQNYNERLLQKYLLENDIRDYDVLILGSSRVMDIGTPLFPEGSFRNVGVSGASVEDLIALYFLYEKEHGKPRKVVIGVDAWLLNAASGRNRWKSLAKEYEYGKGKIQGKEIDDFCAIDLEKYTQLISWPYLNESIKKIKSEVGGNGRNYCLADDKCALPDNAQIKCSDGSILRSVEMLAADAEPKARSYISGKEVYSLEKYNKLDERLCKEVRMFISYLKSHGIEIVLYLPPYHPIVYSFLQDSEKYRIVLEAEDFFRAMAEDYGMPIVGSYDPERCGLSNKDFLDGMHMRRESVEMFLRGKL